MRHTSWYLSAAIALVLIGSSVADAQQQHPQTREGWWFSAGTGVAARFYNCKGCDSLPRQPRGLGPTLRLRLGGSFDSHLLLGMQVDVWAKSSSGVTSFAGVLSPAIYYYPSDSGGFFFGFGFGHLGYASYAGADNQISNGFGLIVGVGRDYRVRRSMSISTALNLIVGGFGALNENDALRGRSYSQTMLELGVGITFH